MQCKITYPTVDKRKLQRQKFIRVAQWPFLIAALICPVMNLLTGGSCWSLIVLVSLYIGWRFLIAPEMVEVNRISLFIKLIFCTVVLILSIGLNISVGWTVEIGCSICFVGLIVSAVLFFTDLQRQKQNMLPMILLIGLSLLSSVIGLIIWRDETRWALAVMGVLALILLLACFIILGADFIRELKKRFHTK